MRQEKHFIIPCIVALLLTLQSLGQTGTKGRIKHKIVAGFNIGASAPVGLSNTIRKINSYNPLINPSIGYQAIYSLNEQWSVGAGAGIDIKGMKVTDSVMYFHTLVTSGTGADAATFEGNFTGTNYTYARSTYATIPIFAQFKPSRHWQYQLGGYIAFLLKGNFNGNVSNGYIRKGNSLGEKVEIELATFNFSDRFQKFDVGLHAGAERNIGTNWGITAQLQWGLKPIFPSSFSGISFPLYNIFGKIGVSYNLK